jgi:thiamine-phosphate pyrophosphorylase
VSFVFKKPLVYLISDGSLTDQNYQMCSSRFLDLVGTAVEVNIPLIQIREKKLSTKWLLELARQCADLCSGSETKILLNDRLDIAVTAGACGVHLTSSSVPTDVVRSVAPAGFLVGVSAHSIGELATARDLGADFAVFGPIFETPMKGESIGLNALRDAVNELTNFPVLALGGINETNYQEVVATGCAGFAAIRFLNDVTSLKTVSTELSL